MDNIQKAQSIVGYRPKGRPERDFYPTPREGTVGLLDHESFTGYIWEPACGDGAMTRVLQEYGYAVFNSDIEPRTTPAETMDFLKTDLLMTPCIVTNPPFSLAQQFAEHALQLGATKVALLCKLAFLEGQKRTKWLEKSPLQTVYVFKKRLSLYRNGAKLWHGGMIAFAWFVWYKYQGNFPPVIKWI